MRCMTASVATLALFLSFWPVLARATSVRSVSVGEMVERSQVVFEGRVVAVEVVEEGSAGSIRTCVLFEILDLIKGAIAGNTLELCFEGGTVGDRTRWVAGMVYPEPGESGIYFIEDVDRPLVNPVYGWDQGRFPIRVPPGDTEPRVTVADGTAVVGLAGDDPGAREGLSNGVAIGVEVDSKNSETLADSVAERSLATGSGRAMAAMEKARTPLSPTSFKARVRALIEDSRQ